MVLTALITAHEFGHFLMARRSGVRVKEFGIGFPPRAIAWVRSKPEKGKKKGKWTRIKREDWQKEQNSLIFSLNWLPIGGFCAMDGESDDETRPGTFGSVSFWKKTKILFGGVAMNWLVAFIILTVLCWTGLPEITTNQFTVKSDERITADGSVVVEKVLENSPAAKAGFEVGDKILALIDSSGVRTEVKTSNDVVEFNNKNAGETVEYAVSRQVEEQPNCIKAPCEPITYHNKQTLTVTLNESGAEYLLGVTMSSPYATYNYTWSAPLVAAGLTVQLTGETFEGLGNLVVNLVTGTARQISSRESVREEGKAQLESAGNSVSGVVGIVGNYFPSLLSSGPTYIFLFTAIISISLACMNVLPIPALDGGRWFMIFLCRLRRKKLSQETEQRIISKAFVFLIILMIIITIMDIIKLF